MFPLFQSHIDLAHHYWKQIVQHGDHVIDATCGNGHDALVLANLALLDGRGELYALDIQPTALRAAQQHLEQHLTPACLSRIRLLNMCHSEFPAEIQPESIKLIAYNLGYLPGGDKSLTTTSATTIKSLQQALVLVKPGGAICLTAYPGHDAGHIEQQDVHVFMQKLDPKVWSCCCHRWVNRTEHAPALYLLQKAKN